MGVARTSPIISIILLQKEVLKHVFFFIVFSRMQVRPCLRSHCSVLRTNHVCTPHLGSHILHVDAMLWQGSTQLSRTDVHLDFKVLADIVNVVSESLNFVPHRWTGFLQSFFLLDNFWFVHVFVYISVCFERPG